MPPWTERLLTKFKKLSSGVRRMNSRQQPVASTKIRGYHDATSGYRLSRSRFVSAGRADSSQGAESFSNTQSVPDSCNDVKAWPARCSHALSSAPSVNNLSDESCLSLQLSSSAADSTASSDLQPPGGSAARKRTPKLRISDSSRISDAKEVTAVLNQLAARNHRSRLSVRLSDKPDAPAVQPEDLQQKQQKQHQADDQEVSFPASCPLLPRRRLLLQAAAAEPLMVTLIQQLDGEDDESGGREQPLLLLNNRRSQPPPTPRARASIADSTLAASPSPTFSRDARRSRRRSPQRQRQQRHQEQQELRVPRRPRSTADAGFTRTIAFSVAREDSDAEVRPAERRQRRDVRIASPFAGASTPSTSSMTTTSSTTATTMTTATSTATASASPGRRRRLRQRQRLLRLRSANSVGSTPFVPTFSKIVEWSEATDSRNL